MCVSAAMAAAASDVHVHLQLKLSSPICHAVVGKRSRLSVSAAAAAPSDGGSSPAKEFSSAFYRTRLLTFAAMFVGYGSYYLTRNSLGYVVPTLLNDKAVGLTMTQIGGLTSVLPVCYGMDSHLYCMCAMVCLVAEHNV